MHKRKRFGFELIEVYVPASIRKKIKEVSEKKLIPMSRLVLFAIDNELDQEEPFRYDIPEPNVYVEYEYAIEAGRIIKFLENFKSGLSIDQIITMRREIGVQDKQKLINGLEELLNTGVAIKIKPRATYFRHPDDYRHICLSKFKKREASVYKSVSQMKARLKP